MPTLRKMSLLLSLLRLVLLVNPSSMVWSGNWRATWQLLR